MRSEPSAQERVFGIQKRREAIELADSILDEYEKLDQMQAQLDEGIAAIGRTPTPEQAATFRQEGLNRQANLDQLRAETRNNYLKIQITIRGLDGILGDGPSRWTTPPEPRKALPDEARHLLAQRAEMIAETDTLIDKIIGSDQMLQQLDHAVEQKRGSHGVIAGLQASTSAAKSKKQITDLRENTTELIIRMHLQIRATSNYVAWMLENPRDSPDAEESQD